MVCYQKKSGYFYCGVKKERKPFAAFGPDDRMRPDPAEPGETEAYPYVSIFRRIAKAL